MSIIEQILLDVVVWAFPEVLNPTISLDVPPKKELGDFAFNIFPYAKITKLAPPAIAEKVAEGLKKHAEYFKDVSIMGGYVNFFLTNAAWADIFRGLSTEEKQGNGKTIVVDYIGANAGKPLHIGHICTPSIGQAILNMHQHLGYATIGDSHFGDWGGIFGKLIYAWNKEINIEKKMHNLEKEWADYLLRLYQEAHKDIEQDIEIYNTLLNNYIRQIDESEYSSELKNWGWKKIIDWKDVDLFRKLEAIIKSKDLKINTTDYIWEFQNIEWLTREEFKKLSEWDPENVELWKKFTSISIAEVNKKLELINVQPKYNIGESFYEGLDLPRPNSEDYPDLRWNMKDIVNELVEKGVATRNEDGSVGVVFPEETKIPSCILQKKDGTGLYLTSDLAAIKYRMTNGWNPSKIVYSVDARQQLHLKQAFTIARMAWPELLGDTELYHAFNGFIKLKEGAMSTRKGTVIFLSDLITEGFNRTKAILEGKGQSLADSDIQAITIAAIKYSYLGQDREKDVVFDWDKALSFEGNSGPYIQYSYVRAKNIVEKAILSEAGNLLKNDEICMKTANRSEPYDCTESEETQSLNAKFAFYKDFLLSEYDRSCLRRLSFFDKAVEDSATKYKPHILATYCYDLATEFNSFYVHTPKILEEQDGNLRNFRLALIAKVRDTLQKGFELLAINMPEKM